MTGNNTKTLPPEIRRFLENIDPSEYGERGQRRIIYDEVWMRSLNMALAAVAIAAGKYISTYTRDSSVIELTEALARLRLVLGEEEK